MGELIQFPLGGARQRSLVRTEAGEVRWVKNLGWLLRHAREVVAFEVFEIEHRSGMQVKDVRMIAHVDNGSTFETEWADRRVCYKWLDRPLFRGLPIAWFSIKRQVGDV